MNVQVFPDLKNLSQAVATLFVQLAQEALVRERFSVALSGGSTPREAYRLLSQSPFMDQVPWRIVHFFWGDERWVPPQDPNSNEGMARRLLLDHIPVPEAAIHPMYRAGVSVQDAATEYDHLLRQFFAGEPACFDLVLLGLGENGHTASLFPHTPVLQPSNRWVEEVFPPGQALFRMTLLPEVINRSRQVIFMVSGAEKAEALQQVLEGPRNPEEYPAQLIQPRDGRLLWLVDEAAAQKLSGVTLQTFGVMQA